ncbi:LutC/YkgG family protein [Pedobacter mucosus]|uniref:LutC/YkgG family protein n=1 Tax=Pedobacter mucosus TaxID=2895286 RepID=UPI001EE3CAB8|nr:LUD domain-containing protein [Pedobacter mucosus]UKT65372.1 LUD domain-containing protein [Pedobacter mucosus]
MSRAQILAAVLNNQPLETLLPADLEFDSPSKDLVIEKFVETITMIGGQVIKIKSLQDIENYISENYLPENRILSQLTELTNYYKFSGDESPHELENTDFAVFNTHFAVAENGAVWITEDQMGHRVLPFITQHLAMVVKAENIVANMHQAYKIIENQDYGFGTFIAGPSKTADIEQSLVLGAHGARSMTIFLLEN